MRLHFPVHSMNHLVLWQIFAIILLISRDYTFSLILECDTKIPVDLDISRKWQKKILSAPSEEFANGVTYIMDPNYEDRYRIGRIVDGSELVSEDHFKNLERIVLVIDYSDGTKYVEVNTMSSDDYGVMIREIEEVARRPGDSEYKILERVPIDLEIMMEESTAFIKVTDFVEINVRNYAIQEDQEHVAIIGVVRFGEYIIDKRVDCLISKYVILDGSENDPHVRIASFLTGGICIESKYEFVGGKEPFVLVEERSWQYF